MAIIVGYAQATAPSPAPTCSSDESWRRFRDGESRPNKNCAWIERKAERWRCDEYANEEGVLAKEACACECAPLYLPGPPTPRPTPKAANCSASRCGYDCNDKDVCHPDRRCLNSGDDCVSRGIQLAELVGAAANESRASLSPASTFTRCSVDARLFSIRLGGGGGGGASSRGSQMAASTPPLNAASSLVISSSSDGSSAVGGESAGGRGSIFAACRCSSIFVLCASKHSVFSSLAEEQSTEAIKIAQLGSHRPGDGLNLTKTVWLETRALDLAYVRH